jgi:hypothetical protein
VRPTRTDRRAEPAIQADPIAEAAAAHPVASAFVLWLPSPAFPLGLAALGIALAWSRLAPLWLGGLLVLAGVAFPLTRITRTAAIAHAVDLLILVVFVTLALLYTRTGLRRTAIEPARGG